MDKILCQRFPFRVRISWLYNNFFLILFLFSLFPHVVSDHTKVQYFVNVPNVSSYSEEDLEKLQETIIILLNANYDDVIVCGIKNGCVIVTFMIRKYLITHLWALCASKEKILVQRMLHHKIFKVMIRDAVLYRKGICSYSILTMSFLFSRKITFCIIWMGNLLSFLDPQIEAFKSNAGANPVQRSKVIIQWMSMFVWIKIIKVPYYCLY